MDLEGFFAPQVLIVVGKGGVGKTTVSAALGVLASRRGRRVLLVEVEGKGALANVLRSRALSYREEQVGDGLWARTITPEDALVDYFRDHNLGKLSRRLASSGVMDYVATAVPGLKDIIVLGKVKQIANVGVYDTIVVDAPAAGHAVTFLTGARGILDAVRLGRIRDQARDVLDLLEDHGRCRVQLVTIPEETPVNETVETTQRLRDRVDMSIGPILVNSWVDPALEPPPDPSEVERIAEEVGAPVPESLASALSAAARFRAARRRVQDEQLSRLVAMVDQPVLRLPFVFSPDFGPAELRSLTVALEEQLETQVAPA